MSGIKLFFIGTLFSFCLFLPSLNVFFTNDDFFHLSISRAAGFTGVLSFFNPVRGPENLKLYRPLTTQLYYWISLTFFNHHSLPLHIISFCFLFMIGLLIYLIAASLSESYLVGGIAAYYYLISAVHFGHLYYTGTFQELGLALFYLSSTLLFIKKKHFISFVLFVLALLSKETAVMLPMIHVVIHLFLKRKPADLLKLLLPYVVILLIYAFFRIGFYGFATGDSYQWELSPKIFNTVIWYGLWSLNLPEMFLDFIGPGLHLNPNLLKFWGQNVFWIVSVFSLFIGQIIFALFKYNFKQNISLIIFSVFWFLITLGPLLFLPWHKFSYNLTVPLFAVSLMVGSIAASVSKSFRIILLVTVFFLSFRTVDLTRKTSWITSGQATAARFDSYFRSELAFLPGGARLVFYDSPADKVLPWSPAMVLKNILSDNNYFKVFADKPFTAEYLPAPPDRILPDQKLIPARQFLGY
jgi:hypothetical protein